eukprot:GHVN01095227.1.p1 GENE.GHVN01095227.1~~GHVN01095227.1.p1  ORF type:complete len:207 (-),score=65.33 GHVN01095227.1:218-838(-)
MASTSVTNQTGAPHRHLPYQSWPVQNLHPPVLAPLIPIPTQSQDPTSLNDSASIPTALPIISQPASPTKPPYPHLPPRRPIRHPIRPSPSSRPHLTSTSPTPSPSLNTSPPPNQPIIAPSPPPQPSTPQLIDPTLLVNSRFNALATSALTKWHMLSRPLRGGTRPHSTSDVRGGAEVKRGVTGVGDKSGKWSIIPPPEGRMGLTSE